jgi:hypothetical protein
VWRVLKRHSERFTKFIAAARTIAGTLNFFADRLMTSDTWAKARRIGVIVLVIVLLWLLSVIVLGLLAPDPMWENGRPSDDL